MFRFIVQDGSSNGRHFRKYNFISEVEKCVCQNLSYATSNSINMAASSTYREEPDRYQVNSHAYRIKDLVDAINTSVVLEGNKKEQYIKMLTNADSEFNSDSEFVEICHDLGECDVL